MPGMDVEKIMRLIDFKHHVQDKLCSIYNESESEVIFYELIENFLGITKIKYIVDKEHLISNSEILILNQKINQLELNEPLQYVIGNKKIFGINFKLNDSVLIPRPETEELCSWILSHQLNDIKILDIGAGSGLIALVLKKHIKNSTVDGWDNSIKALSLAKSNAKKNNININFKLNDIFKKDIPKNEYDLIVSNPPYVKKDDLAKLSKEVLYDPLISLEGGLTGLRSYFKIAKEVHKHLKKDGFVILEIGIGQLKQVDNIFLNQGFRRILKEKDLQGIDRVVVYQYKVRNI